MIPPNPIKKSSASIKQSKYLTTTKHDEYWPFYHCDFKFGKVILTINTAHPFFTKVWQPLSELASTTEAATEMSDDGLEITTDVSAICREALVGIQAMLLSLGRTQGQMIGGSTGSEQARIFNALRTQWSENLSVQLQSK